MSFFGLSSLITSILGLFIGIFVISKNKRSLLNVSWSCVSFSTSVWSFGLFGVVFFEKYNIALFCQYLLDFSAIYIPIFFFLFVLVLLDIYKGVNKIVFRIFLSFGCVLSLLSFTKLFKLGISPKFGFRHWIDPGIIYPIFPLFFSVLVFLSIYILLRNYKKLSGLKKQQAIYVLVTALISFGGGVTNFFPQLINIYPFGSFCTMFYILGIGYAIARYRLMDIRVVVSKSILYFLLVGIVTFAFTSITFITGQFFEAEGFSKIFVSVFVSFAIVLGFDPLKRFLARITDKIFFKDKIDYQDVLKKLGFIIAKEIELKKLFIDLSEELEKSIKCRDVNFLYQNTVTGMYKGFESGDIFFTKNDEIINYLQEKKQIIVVEELDRLAREQKNDLEKQRLLSIVDRLDKMKIGLIAPIVSENQITALLCIDKKLSGDTFSEEDIGLLSVLTPQVAMALEKAKLYNEIQDLNLHLQERVERATLSLRQVNIDLETKNKYLTALQKISNVITRSLDFQEVASFIATSIKKEMGFVAGVINFIDEDGKAMYIGAMTIDEDIKKVVGFLPKKPHEYSVSFSNKDNLAIKAMTSGNIEKSSSVFDVFKPAITKDQADKMQKELNAKSAIAVPMYSENKIIGSIDFFSYAPIDKLKKIDIEIMKALTDQTGLVIKNINLYKELRGKNEELEDANEHLKQLDRAKSEFLSIASHQLRTPLTGIKGYLSMMLEGDFGKFSSKQNSVLKDIFLASDRMSKLVNVFLNVSRIESGRLKLDLQEVEISEIIKESVENLKPNAESKGITLLFKDLRKKQDQTKIKLDVDKIKDVFLNLIDNSIKYTPKGAVNIELNCDDKNIIVKIKDTGVGLSEEEIDRLFSKFSRGNDSAKINTDGSGLGLYIARKMVEIHGGKIWVESEGLGKGSVFQFTIPNNLK
ncbi:MAG TPA: ATP-binding protein [bacterium]|jgi:signal transduction histidine kinase|nr:ATP-binding protein [bacterium]HOG37933.1 ATP-binding protein [bacterium]HQI02991.1 ATP-binding protein [bacterium]